jgi:prepilin-type N-terminal cleavage/methylation domain-containing protein
MNTHSDILSAEQAPENDKGFTLVELLIVIVILGVLSTVTVFAVSGITDRGRDSSCKADRQVVEVAVEAFYAQSTAVPPAYPANMAALVSAGLLREASTLHTVSAGATPATPSIIAGTGVCA